MNELERKVEALAQRVQLLEDELAIQRLIVRYGLAVDIGDADQAAAVFSEDGVYDVDVRLMRGRDDVRAMVQSEYHQRMVGHCAHQIGPVIVRVAGDTALALGYSRVYLHGSDGIRIHRVSMNRWALARHQGTWRITHRRTRLLGHEEAKAIFESGLDEQ